MAFKERIPDFKIYSMQEKKEFVKKLNKQFGIEKLDGIILTRGTDRLFFYTGDLPISKIVELEHMRLNIERCGVYFAKMHHGTHRGTRTCDAGEIRLSIEGVHILRDQIKKNIYELDSEQAQKWMEGSELNVKSGMSGFVVMKHKDYFLGCGKASAEKIGNFVPKNRRLKIKNN
jgi:NOL1/NOP2/fmu family ribosome biogenesis protein